MNPPSARTILGALACGRAGCVCQKAARNGHGNTHCPVPAHQDSNPSFSVTEKGGTVLVYCQGGCGQEAVIEVLRAQGLWPERSQDQGAGGSLIAGQGRNSARVPKSVFKNGPGSVAVPPEAFATVQGSEPSPNTNLDPDTLPPGLGAAARGLTLEQLAEAKKLPADFLSLLGCRTITYRGTRAVAIPYRDADGLEQAMRYRTAVIAKDGSLWRKGDRLLPYGLDRLQVAKAAGWALFAEGETDCWTGWRYDLPVFGLPGKATWQSEWAQFFLELGVQLVLWEEPGAEDLTERMVRDLPELQVIPAPAGVKDLSEAHLQGMDVAAWVSQLKAAALRPAKELVRQRRDARLVELRLRCQPVLDAPDPLELVREALVAGGYGGDLGPALLTYLAVTSRLLAMRVGAMPVHILLLGPPASGKTWALGRVLWLLPAAAVYVVDAGSPRVLIYDSEAHELRHRVVVFGEADSLPAGEDNPAASAIRNLLADHYLHYKVTVRHPKTGQFVVRTIRKEGPSVLITTAVRKLGEQLDSRVFSLDLPDDFKQVRSALSMQARLELLAPVAPPAALIAYQAYLQAAAPWDCVVPFVERLAGAIAQQPASARIVRDFQRLLALIKSVALLRHQHRNRDRQGRLEAAVEDYETVFELVGDVYAGSVSGAAWRTFAEIVVRLREKNEAARVTMGGVARELGISVAAASRRIKAAVNGGWLVNREARKGHLADLDTGDPLPPVAGLPLPASLKELVVSGDQGDACAVSPLPDQDHHPDGSGLDLFDDPGFQSLIVAGVPSAPDDLEEGAL